MGLFGHRMKKQDGTRRISGSKKVAKNVGHKPVMKNTKRGSLKVYPK